MGHYSIAAMKGIADMALIHNSEAWEKQLAALPVESYDAGATVFAEGTKTGRLLILKSGAVSVFKGDIEFAQVSEPGAVFGELSALLDAPHSAVSARSNRRSFTPPMLQPCCRTPRHCSM